MDLSRPASRPHGVSALHLMDLCSSRTIVTPDEPQQHISQDAWHEPVPATHLRHNLYTWSRGRSFLSNREEHADQGDRKR